MPNHCNTRISISSPTKKQKEILKKIKLDGGLCRYYIPFPSELEGIANGSINIDGKLVRNWREIDGKSVALSEKELKGSKRYREDTCRCYWMDGSSNSVMCEGEGDGHKCGTLTEGTVCEA